MNQQTNKCMNKNENLNELTQEFKKKLMNKWKKKDLLISQQINRSTEQTKIHKVFSSFY